MLAVYTATKTVEKTSMKIAITGHSAGIGQALTKQYEARGHEIIGLSKRHGHNIRNIPKIADQIEPCDMFVNNAQAGFAQTELLFEMARRWKDTKKHIVVISTMMTEYPVSVLPLEKRIKVFDINYDPEVEAKIYSQVEKCRKFYKTLKFGVYV